MTPPDARLAQALDSLLTRLDSGPWDGFTETDGPLCRIEDVAALLADVQIAQQARETALRAFVERLRCEADSHQRMADDARATGIVRMEAAAVSAKVAKVMIADELAALLAAPPAETLEGC